MFRQLACAARNFLISVPEDTISPRRCGIRVVEVNLVESLVVFRAMSLVGVSSSSRSSKDVRAWIII